jgi:hypothetical protein
MRAILSQAITRRVILTRKSFLVNFLIVGSPKIRIHLLSEDESRGQGRVRVSKTKRFCKFKALSFRGF